MHPYLVRERRSSSKVHSAKEPIHEVVEILDWKGMKYHRYFLIL